MGSGLLFGFVPTSSFAMGATLVIVSVILYAKFPPKLHLDDKIPVIIAETHNIPVESTIQHQKINS